MDFPRGGGAGNSHTLKENLEEGKANEVIPQRVFFCVSDWPRFELSGWPPGLPLQPRTDYTWSIPPYWCCVSSIGPGTPSKSHVYTATQQLTLSNNKQSGLVKEAW